MSLLKSNMPSLQFVSLTKSHLNRMRMVVPMSDQV